MENYILPNEILHKISLITNYTSFHSLKYSSSYLNKLLSLDEYFELRFDNKIKEIIGCNPHHFKKLLIKHNAYISGSFILNCLDNSILCKDIDIFIQGFNENYLWDIDLFGRLCRSQYQKFEQELSHLLNIELDDIQYCISTKRDDETLYYKSENDNDIYTKDINSVHNIYLNKIKIDIITTNINPLKFIDLSFDLQCCQYTFNGGKLYIPNNCNNNIFETRIIRISNVYHRYDKRYTPDNLIQLIKSIDIDLLSDNVKNHYKRIINSNHETFDHKNLDDFRMYRLFYRCIKYILKGIIITNFEDYFPNI